MVLYWIIFIIILFFSLKDWKKTVIMWFPVQMLFNECICLKYTSPAVSLVLAVDMLLLAEYLIKRPSRNLNNSPYLFKVAFIAYLVSYGISMIFSILPFTEAATGTIKYFIQSFILVFLFQKALYDRNDIKLFFKTSLIVIILIIALGLYESIMKDNPILDYIYLHAPTDLIIGKMYYVPPFLGLSDGLSMRFGMVRTFSFFGIHIAFGCACILFLYLYIYILKHNYFYLKKNRIICGALLLLLGVLLSNSKTPMVGLLFFYFAFFSLEQVLNFKTIVSLCIIIVAIFFYAPNYLNNITALFDSTVAEEGGGSNVAMRIRQFDVAINMFLNNPLFGNGVGSISTMMKIGNNADLLGAESSWLKILPERGMIGVIAYIILYIQIYKKWKMIMNNRELLFFLFGLLAMETATGFMNFSLYGSILMCIYRLKVLERYKIDN